MKYLESPCRSLFVFAFAMGCLLASTSGCKQQLEKRPKNDAAEEAKTVIDKQTYEAQRLSTIADLGIFDSLKDKIAIESFWPSKGEAAKYVVPEGASNSLVLFVEDFFAEPKLKQFFSFPGDKVKSRVSADFSQDGGTVYVVDTDNMVHVLDVDKADVRKKFKSPIEGAYGILGDVSGKHVFVLNPSTLVKVEIESKKVVGTIENIPGELVDFDRAARADVLAGVTASKQFIVIDKDFTGFELMPDMTTESTHVAIHPEGKYIASSGMGQLFRWHLSETPHRLQGLPANEVTYNYMPVTSDDMADRWFDVFGMHEYQGDYHLQSFLTEPRFKVAYTTAIQVVDVVSTPEAHSTMVGILADGSDKRKYVLTNMYCFDLGNTYYSHMIPIDAEYVSRIWADDSGSRIAMMTNKDIRVVARPRFEDAEGSISIYRFADSIYEGSIDPIENVAKHLRSQNWPNKKKTGEELYGEVITSLSSRWKWAEQNKDNPGAAKAFALLEAWKETGNGMALTASADRHLSIGAQARGGDSASNVTAQGWSELASRVALAKADLQKVFDKGNPPGIACSKMITCQMYDSDSIDDSLAVVKKSMELYPEYLDVHAHMMYRLYPRWGGIPGAVNDYVSMITKLYPQALQDMLYAKLIIMGIDYVPVESAYLPEETNAQIEWMNRGGDELRAKGIITRAEIESLARVAIQSGDIPRAHELLREHLQKYPTLSGSGHGSRVRKTYRGMKNEAFVKAQMSSSNSGANGATP